jgi:hypothetical protein
MHALRVFNENSSKIQRPKFQPNPIGSIKEVYQPIRRKMTTNEAFEYVAYK